MAKQRCLSIAAVVLAGFLASSTMILAQTAATDPLNTLKAGKEAFERICSVCHTLYVPLSLNLDEAGWNTILDRMKAVTSESDAQERERIFAYLTTKSMFETKCSACHGIDRPLSTGKSRAEWLATALRMSGKQTRQFTNAEVASIAAYLAAVRPVQLNTSMPAQ